MFIGDRGTGVGSRIKGFRRYGGRWKEQMHGEAVNVCITDENRTSQTCLFCYNKLIHPKTQTGENRYRSIKGTLLCANPLCISVIKQKAAKSRDALSSLAIGLVGFSTVFFGTGPPSFNSTSQLNTGDFLQITSAFLNERADRHPRCGSGGKHEKTNFFG